MRFSVTIIDRQNAMSEIHRLQSESIVWLRLAPVAEKIHRVVFRVKKIGPPVSTVRHFIQTVVILKSGSRVKSQATRDDIDNAIIVVTDAMTERVFSRLRPQSRLVDWLGKRLRTIVNSLSRPKLLRGNATSAPRPGYSNRGQKVHVEHERTNTV